MEHKIVVTVKILEKKLRIEVKYKQHVKPANDDTVKWTLAGNLSGGKIKIVRNYADFPYSSIVPSGFDTEIKASTFYPDKDNAKDGSYTLEIEGYWDTAHTKKFVATIDPDIVIDRSFLAMDASSDTTIAAINSLHAALAALSPEDDRSDE